ncbi:ribonuclease BN [Lewinellaceae bacterium SD302]|nr:ribonuclease BN [Lewinellaceae bacterium SD302]
MKLPRWMQRIVSFSKELFTNYGKDDAFTLGASLAYYTVFSFGPMLVVIISAASIFMGREAVTGQLYNQLNGLLGADAAETLQGIVESAYRTGDSIWATLLGIGTLLFAATTVFNSLKTSLNRIWEIENRPESTIKSFLLNRVLSFGMVLVLGFMLLVTLVVNAIVGGFVEQIAEAITLLGPAVLRAFTLGLDLIITAIIFACLFRFLPDARARWRDIWVGAFFTSFLFMIGKFLIGLYIGNSDFSTTYGAAGALITLLVWTYYNSQIIFLGAEFTYVWASRSGHPILPGDHAVRVVKEVVTQEPEEARKDLGVTKASLAKR